MFRLGLNGIFPANAGETVLITGLAITAVVILPPVFDREYEKLTFILGIVVMVVVLRKLEVIPRLQCATIALAAEDFCLGLPLPRRRLTCLAHTLISIGIPIKTFVLKDLQPANLRPAGLLIRA
ncbi:hypothetical protein PPS11_40645 [Pseudomonas putida S11]|nr:hypothetical protein PPS11_40645 [Pseudomonas putida S11]